MKKCAIIIPALNPTEALIDYVNELLTKGARQVVVVNDGSIDDCSKIFSKIALLSRCTVLTHEKNKGKGRALKTAFRYILENCHDLHGVITADADGQHAISDVCKIANALEKEEDALLLGVRDFSDTNVPFRSTFGNRSMNFLFRHLFQADFQDTQTGLRGITMELLKKVVNVKGERFEYEINMLIYAQVQKVKIIQIPIQTLYFDRNSGSHFKVIKDSLKIFNRLISGFVQTSSKGPYAVMEEIGGNTNEG